MDTTKNSLAVKNIKKSYARRDVVINVSFSVECGEIIGLIGPNGAGKTTCFYIACGLVSADGGKVYINDQDVTRLPMDKRAKLGLGYLPQEPSVFRKLSVEDNIMAILELNPKLNYQSRVDNLEALLDEFKIGHIRKSLGQSLSGGERRRTEIARALATDPKFILLDEPFAGVDPISVGDIQNIIYHLKKRGIGILITDHNYREMLDTCDYSYVISSGKIIAEGAKDEILSHHEVRKVYLGEENGIR